MLAFANFRYVDAERWILPAASMPVTRPSLTLRSTVLAASLTASTGVFLAAKETLKAAARGALKAIETRGIVLTIGRSIFSVRNDMMAQCEGL